MNRPQLLAGLGTPTILALTFLALSATYSLFKHVEPFLFPVVTDFKITKVQPQGEKRYLYGEFNKRRDCDFGGMVAYSGKHFVDVVFIKPAGVQHAGNRRPGVQTFGPWMLNPDVTFVKIYARHACMTGLVETVLYNGPVSAEWSDVWPPELVQDIAEEIAG